MTTSSFPMACPLGLLPLDLTWMREILEIHTMQIQSDFNEAMTECIRSGCSRQLPPVEIFEQINAILLRFDKIVADAGWTGDLALDTHKDFVAIYSEMVVSIACYESQIADAEIALIEHLKASSTQCLNEESMADGANSERKQALSEALASLYRRGLLKRDARTGSLKLTSAGKIFVESEDAD